MRAGLLCLSLLLAAGPTDAQDGPLRSLRIRSAHAGQRTRQRELEGMTVSVVVETSGFKGSEVGVKVRLTDLDNQPIRAPRGTPAVYRDDRGRARVAEVKRVEKERACETSFALFIPYGAIIPPGRRERRVAVSVSARCGGLSGFTVFGGFLPPMRPPPGAPGLRIEGVALEEEANGFAVKMQLDSGALRRGQVEAGIRMRSPKGAAVRVRANAPRDLTGPHGMLDCRRNWNMGPEGAAGIPVRIFVPYDALDLPKGKELGLALTAFAQVGGWRALQEQEIRLTIGEGIRPDIVPPLKRDDPPKRFDPSRGGVPKKSDDPPGRLDPRKGDDPPKRDDPPRRFEPTKGEDPKKSDDPPKRDDPPEAEPELRVVHPSGEDLSKPYKGHSGSYGMDSNLLWIEAIAVGLKAGAHCLEVDLGSAGRRYVWARAAPESAETRFSAALPVPCGGFKVRLSMQGLAAKGALALDGEMAPHAWAPSEGELEEWSRALEEWRSRREVDADSLGFVVSTLAQMAGGYLLRGDYDRAGQVCNECLDLCKRAEDTEQRAEIDRIRITIYLLQGKLSELDTLYGEWIEKRTEPARRAALYREWAERRAIFDSDPSKARGLWRKAQQEANEAGVEHPSPPAWFE
ncbi:MAG: tetratricopeptide repeat protein [Planctomycetota bacterium]|jgi:hypothetical protein